jgi:WD40 repeat protein
MSDEAALKEALKKCEEECIALQTQLQEKRDLTGGHIGKCGTAPAGPQTLDLKKDIAKKLSEGTTHKANHCQFVDDENLVTWLQNGSIVVWNIATREKSYYLSKNTWFNTGDVSPDKSLIAAGGLDNVVTIYPFPDMKSDYDGCPDDADMKLKVMEKHGGAIMNIKFLNQTTVLSASGDKSIMVWDISKEMGVQKEPEQTLTGHGLLHYNAKGDAQGTVSALDTQAGSDKVFISGAADGLCKLWDLRVDPSTGCAVRTFFSGMTHRDGDNNKDGGISDVKYMPGCDGNFFIAAQENGKCNLWDTRMGSLLGSYQNGETPLTVCEPSRSGRYIFTGSASGKIKAFDTLNPAEVPQTLKQFHTEGDMITALSVNPSGTALASTCRCLNDQAVAFYA